nr:PTS lactose/cellobiose transporter subunit IIA [Propionicimonas sp.]
MQDEEHHVGQARSSYIKAVRVASTGDFDEAARLLAAGRAEYTAGHEIHAALLTEMAGGGDIVVDLLLAHAEDQLMGADQLLPVADAFIEVHKRLLSLERELRGGPADPTV